MRPDPAFPLSPPSRRVRNPGWPLRRFLLRRALVRFLAALVLRVSRGGRRNAQALAHLDDRLLRDVGIRREPGRNGDNYRRL